MLKRLANFRFPVNRKVWAPGSRGRPQRGVKGSIRETSRASTCQRPPCPVDAFKVCPKGKAGSTGNRRSWGNLGACGADSPLTSRAPSSASGVPASNLPRGRARTRLQVSRQGVNRQTVVVGDPGRLWGVIRGVSPGSLSGLPDVDLAGAVEGVRAASVRFVPWAPPKRRR